MKSRQIHESHGQRTFVVVLEPGEEAMAVLQQFARAERMTAAQISAIGAFESAVLGFWNGERQDYDRHPVREQTEVLSLLGDISEGEDGKPQVHLHAVLGRRDAATLGGHFLEGRVHPTLEVIVTESPAHLRRVHDARAGLAVIKP
jgi:predicted DNA-binding protein with PD1-like motif